ncbi:MAG: FAD-dependent thymidylate synthase, partial [Acidobacteria bacterium]|nr:FAD-dependent thymidylate synthase [Acidobacteriota bacterium]
QAYEMLLLRMRAHPLAESRQTAEVLLSELRKVIPDFVRRVDMPGRGGVWSDYFRRRDHAIRELTNEIATDDDGGARAEVTLSEFDPEGEVKVVAAALYPNSHLPLDRLLILAGDMATEERARILENCVGDRGNRRHRPDRAFEHATYTFDIVSDYGAFRDLQRHRMLTLEWQSLTPSHGYERSEAVEEIGALADWERAMADSAALYERLARRCSPLVAQYAVLMAYRIRFYMRMNAREAMHLIELRTSPQGHEAYRRVCQEMHRLIARQAGHRAIADAMSFVNREGSELGRLKAERASMQGRLPLETT